MSAGAGGHVRGGCHAEVLVHALQEPAGPALPGGCFVIPNAQPDGSLRTAFQSADECDPAPNKKITLSNNLQDLRFQVGCTCVCCSRHAYVQGVHQNACVRTARSRLCVVVMH